MLDMAPETIQIIIQGGAVGLFFVAIVLGYNLLRLAVDRVSDFVGNHLAHNTEAVKEGTEVMREVAGEVKRMSDKLDK